MKSQKNIKHRISENSYKIDLMRASLFPFANFLINQKNRSYADVSTLFFNPAALEGEKSTALRSITQGRASFKSTFAEYAPVPQNVQNDLIKNSVLVEA